jgi:hypothetical protein
MEKFAPRCAALGRPLTREGLADDDAVRTRRSRSCERMHLTDHQKNLSRYDRARITPQYRFADASNRPTLFGRRGYLAS